MAGAPLPRFTRLALYARLDADGTLSLVNHLGVRLGDDAEEALRLLESGGYSPDDVEPCNHAAASDREYAAHVRDVDAASPARFNADPRRLFEASGSAGLIILFAARQRVDALLPLLPRNLSARMPQRAAKLAGDHLPPRLRAMRDSSSRRTLPRIYRDQQL